MADGVEAIPRLAEREAELLVVADRALEVVDKELWSEGCDARLRRGRTHRCLLSSAQDLMVMRPAASGALLSLGSPPLHSYYASYDCAAPRPPMVRTRRGKRASNL